MTSNAVLPDISISPTASVQLAPRLSASVLLKSSDAVKPPSGDAEGVADGVADTEGVAEGDGVALGVREGVAEGLGVALGVADGVALTEGVADGLGVAEGVADGVALTDGVAEGVLEGVGIPPASDSAPVPTTYHVPSPPFSLYSSWYCVASVSPEESTNILSLVPMFLALTMLVS